MNQFKILETVTLRGAMCQVISIFLNDADDLFYVVRDEQRRTHHAIPSELVSA